MATRKTKRTVTSRKAKAAPAKARAASARRVSARAARKVAVCEGPDAPAGAAPSGSSPPQAWADDARSNVPYVERLSDGRWILAAWVEETGEWRDVTLDAPARRAAATLEALAAAGAQTYVTLQEAKRVALGVIASAGPGA